MRVLIFRGTWSPNIGNAFVNFGLEAIIRKVIPNAEILYSGDPTNNWYFYASQNDYQYSKNSFNVSAFMDVDLIVWGGMILTEECFLAAGEVFRNLSENNIPILFIGAGADKYDEEEAVKIDEYMASLKRVEVITRDDDTYNLIYGKKGVNNRLYRGIDCAFFLPDYYEAPKLNLPRFDVESFDYIDTPMNINHLSKMVIKTHHDCWGKLPLNFVNEPNTVVSDMPYDYLTLYANADTTYTERVHACIATLSYGNKAQLYSDTHRASLFSRMSNENNLLEKMKNEPVKLDMNMYQKRKDDMIKTVRYALEELLNKEDLYETENIKMLKENKYDEFIKTNDENIDKLQTELNSIYNSRLWKFGTKYRKIKNKILKK
jgi:polysaccharide pyruvyl transferase WcaK-like protein